MAPLSLKAAARESGVAKTTLLRSIRDGRLSATKDDKGSWSVDPSELFRAFPRRADPQRSGSTGGSVVQNRPSPEPPSAGNGPTLETRLAVAEAKLMMLEQVNQDLRVERDSWKGQAERLALAPPPRSLAPWWWPWQRSA